MRRSSKTRAELGVTLGAAALCASVCAAVPGLPPLSGEGILLGVGFTPLFPLHAATVSRSIALEFRARGHVGDRTNQRRALKALPRRVGALLVGLGPTHGLLLSGVSSDGSGLQATDADRGRSTRSTSPFLGTGTSRTRGVSTWS